MLNRIQRILQGKPENETKSTAANFLADDPRYSSFDIGIWSYGNPQIFSWGEDAKLKIGRFCAIANGVIILLGGEHRTDWITTFPFNTIFSEASTFKGHPKTKGDVIIGNDVWIGQDALILSGTTIGNGAVVAARSVITKDVEPYAIVGGNPAKLIRFRFSPSTISELEKIAWWDWPLPKIKGAWPLLMSSNIDEFIETYRSDKSFQRNQDRADKI